MDEVAGSSTSGSPVRAARNSPPSLILAALATLLESAISSPMERTVRLLRIGMGFPPLSVVYRDVLRTKSRKAALKGSGVSHRHACPPGTVFHSALGIAF